MDPMIDPATGQPYEDPRQRVSQALMAQRRPVQDINGMLQRMLQMRQFGHQPMATQLGARPPDPVMGTGYPANPMDQASSLSTMQKPWYSGYTQPGGGT